MKRAAFDYIVVGAGSAGCVVASRLGQKGLGHRVLLLESGGHDWRHWSNIFLHMPTALSIPMNMDRYNWGFEAEPEPSLGGRALHCPRGKVLGGSSAINGMAYVRGHPLDFDRWEDLGASGWNYQNCLPYFKRAETWEGGEDDYRGRDGPLQTRFGVCRNPLYHAFIEAGQQAGYPYTEDYNGYQQEGFGKMAMSVDAKGKRSSTSNAYLHSTAADIELEIETNSTVRRITFHESTNKDEKPRARGIEVLTQRGEVVEVMAEKEVILCAGAIGSPHLLQLSGIGDSQHIEEIGVPLVAERKGVGQNLMDHLEILVQRECTEPISLYKHLGVIGKLNIGIQWILSQLFPSLLEHGLGGTNHFESCGFIRSVESESYPDIQYHFVPVAISYDGNSSVQAHGFQAHVGPMRSESRGYVRAKTAKVEDHPEIKFNYMSKEKDWKQFRDCIRTTRRIFEQPALQRYAGREIAPGSHVQSDEELDQFIRERVETAYHPCGTCRMGDPNDLGAVVDSETRVIGVDGLRVVDSSIFPSITNGNLNAPTIMVAERAADFILGVEPLPSANVEIAAPVPIPNHKV